MHGCALAPPARMVVNMIDLFVFQKYLKTVKSKFPSPGFLLPFHHLPSLTERKVMLLRFADLK